MLGSASNEVLANLRGLSHASHHRNPAAERGRRPDPRRRPVLHPRLQHRVPVASPRPTTRRCRASRWSPRAPTRSSSRSSTSCTSWSTWSTVEDMTRGEHLERELLLLKLASRTSRSDAVRPVMRRAGGRVLHPTPGSFLVELTASEAEINPFIADLAPRAELLEVVRSGALGISQGQRVLRLPDAGGPPAHERAGLPSRGCRRTSTPWSSWSSPPSVARRAARAGPPKPTCSKAAARGPTRSRHPRQPGPVPARARGGRRQPARQRRADP